MNTASAAQRYPYPGVRVGGLFLLIVGTAIVAAGMVGESRRFPVFLTGFVAAFIALGAFAHVLQKPLGRMTLVQNLAIPAAILLEMVLVALLFRVLPDPGSRGFMLGILFVVGVHFLPFAVPSGPLCLLVAALCCANAALGWYIPTEPIAVVWITDGLIKAGVGIAMLRAPTTYLRSSRSVAGKATLSGQ